MKNKIWAGMVLLFAAGSAFAQKTSADFSNKFRVTFRPAVMNYAGYHAALLGEYQFSERWGAGLFLQYLYNQAEHPIHHEHIKLSHRAKSHTPKDRITYGAQISYKMGSHFFSFGDFYWVAQYSYLKTRYQNRFWRFDNDSGGKLPYTLTKLNDDNVKFSDLLIGLSGHTPLFKKVYLNTHATIGACFINGINLPYLDKSNYVKSAYNLAIGISYKF